MKIKRGLSLVIAGSMLGISVMTSVANAVSVTDIQHLQKTLLSTGKASEADDYNGDGVINAVDLSLMKRALLNADNDTGTSKASVIPATESNVKLIGRTMQKNDVTWLVQSGSAAECTVTGTEASVTIAGDGCVYSDEQWRPRYGVFVDDELIADVVMGEPEQTVQLFSGATQRTAKVKIMHLSEANNGAIGVKQFDVVSSAKQPVKPTAKKDLTIEFIGDSITCAYGVEADTQYVNFATGTENFSKSYAYLTAQLLDADYSAVSYSGHGIISGYTSTDEPEINSLVPPYYTMVGKLDDYQSEWDFESHPSDVVVLNLGTNDDTYAGKDLETRGKEYQDGYVDFLKLIREKNPDAAIICTLGIMGCEELYPYIEAAVAEVNDPKISCYLSPTQNAADGYGADWHPSPITHEKNSYLLADKICTAIGRESSKIGIDLAFESNHGFFVDESAGANAWPYFNDYDKSLNLNVSSAGDSPESIRAFMQDISLPKGGYELAFTAKMPAGSSATYAVRSMSDPKKVYCTGEVDSENMLVPFEMTEADDAVEIVFLIGENKTGNFTFVNVTLYKRS